HWGRRLEDAQHVVEALRRAQVGNEQRRAREQRDKRYILGGMGQPVAPLAADHLHQRAKQGRPRRDAPEEEIGRDLIVPGGLLEDRHVAIGVAGVEVGRTIVRLFVFFFNEV